MGCTGRAVSTIFDKVSIVQVERMGNIMKGDRRLQSF
jgi:hypothetical protein